MKRYFNSELSVLAFPQLPSSLPRCSLWCWSGLTGGGFKCFATCTIWLVVVEWVPFLLDHCKLLLLSQDLGSVISSKKSGLKPAYKTQYLRMLIDVIQN